MTKTKKQKEREIPLLRNKLILLRNDLSSVKDDSVISCIMSLISETENKILEYEEHVADPYVNRRGF